MCWSKKCCFFVELDTGCLLIGILNLVISAGICIASIVFLEAQGNRNFQHMHNTTQHVLGVFHLDLDPKSKTLILSIIVLVAFLSMVSSMVHIVGVRMRKPGLVLTHFAFSIFVTFLMGLCSLLLLLETSSWFIALLLIGAALINIHFLVVVHTFYELLVVGKVFEQTLQQSEFDDCNILIETDIYA